MAHVAERQETVIELWSVQGQGGLLSRGTLATKRKAKVTMTFTAFGVIKSVGGAIMLDEGLESRDVRRAIAQPLKAKGAEKGVGAGPEKELARVVEKQLRDLQNAQQKRCLPEQKEASSFPKMVLRRSRGRHRNPQRVRQDA